MLMIDFSLGDEDYALPCESVIEVIPRLELSKIEKAPDYVVGMCHLRGEPIPVVDMTLWVTGSESRDRLHTRIIIVEVVKNKSVRKLGLVVENVMRTNQRNRKAFVDSGVRMKELPFLGGIATEGIKTRKLVLLEPLVKMLERVIFPEMG